MSHKKMFIGALCLSLVALCLGMWTANRQSHVVEPHYFGTVLPSARDIPAFSLTGTDGAIFSERELTGQWTLMFFGFTQCGYLCPTTMNTLATMFRMLEKSEVTPLPHVVMLSVDPEHDTQTRLAQYVAQFHPNFYGARGDNKTVKRLAKALGIAYQSVAKTNQIEHSGAILVLNPAGKLVAFFTTPHDANHLAADYRQLIS